jgi:hypothetical protein
MDWIKRNLYFLIGSLVAVALMGLAGWYLYSKWDLNNTLLGQLDAQYAELKRLSEQKPHPGSGKVDNIQAAKDQQKELRAWIEKACGHFQRIAPIPVSDSGKISAEDFTFALSRTIERLHHDAEAASVTLPPKNSAGQTYSFSFEEQRPRLSFAPGSLAPLSVQLGEVKAICDVLFQAKVNALDGLRRERVSDDDQKGPQTDYLSDTSVTNELAVLTPYEVTFRGFSTELAAVLSGFASSPYGIIVKSINVEQAPAAATEQPGVTPTPAYVPQVQMYIPPPNPRAAERSATAAFNDRYGLSGRRAVAPPPQPAPQPVYSYAYTPAATARTKGGLPTVLDEKQLKITMALVVVKLTCPK